MIFGGWQGILFGEGRGGRASLAEVGDFFVEVGQGGFEGFAVVGVGGGGEVIGDAGTG